jgi:predicted CXXCH cytochrome family protein
MLSRPQETPFPHARHQGIFPTCTACHEGIEAGEPEQSVSVEPTLCGGCHDGTNLPAVAWEGRAEQPAGNLKTVHPGHPELPCGACHQTPGTGGEMEVQAAAAEACMACHAPGTEDHQAAGVPCAQCHMTLSEAPAMTAATIAAFSAPPDHGSADFAFQHGAAALDDVARCSVCHARESCTRCHANAAAVAPIMALAADGRVAEMVTGREGSWPIPPSHQASDWQMTHSALAETSPQSCSTCHAAETCSACHLDTGDRVTDGFPEAHGASARAVPASGEVPGHGPTFAVAHGEAAVAATPKCSACHAETFCIDCHDGAGRPVFHPVNFVQRHPAEAWAAPMECAECHSREVFCRNCHESQGAGQDERTAGGYHDADPNWFQSHGQAARQNLETCVSCHQQDSCLRCHSAKEGFRINPHGPDFDPEHVREKSEMSCGICHFGFQLDSP